MSCSFMKFLQSDLEKKMYECHLTSSIIQSSFISIVQDLFGLGAKDLNNPAEENSERSCTTT